MMKKILLTLFNLSLAVSVHAVTISNPELFDQTTDPDSVMVLFNWFMGLGISLLIPILIIALAMVITMRS